MKIARVEATWLQVPIPEAQQHTSDFGRATTFDTALVRIDTDAGLTGWGEAKVSAGSFGDYGGVPMQWLWALLDVLTLIVLGSGLYLWLGKDASRRPAPARPRSVGA